MSDAVTSGQPMGIDLQLEQSTAFPARTFQALALVSAVCRTSMSALTTLTDGGSYVCADLGDGPEITPLEDTFCQFTIQSPGEVLEVPDAFADDRFRDLPAVAEGRRIRFYAGVALTDHEQNPVGALCVLDTAPRKLTAQQRSLLVAVASSCRCR